MIVGFCLNYCRCITAQKYEFISYWENYAAAQKTNKKSDPQKTEGRRKRIGS